MAGVAGKCVVSGGVPAMDCSKHSDSGGVCCSAASAAASEAKLRAEIDAVCREDTSRRVSATMCGENTIEGVLSRATETGAIYLRT